MGKVWPEQRVFELKPDDTGRQAIGDGEIELPSSDLGSDAVGRELAGVPHHLAQRVHPPGRFGQHRLDERRVSGLRLSDNDRHRDQSRRLVECRDQRCTETTSAEAVTRIDHERGPDD